MTEFEWIDRHGIAKKLDAPTAIEVEVEVIASEIDHAVERLLTADQSLKAELRRNLTVLTSRLEQLKGDRERWDKFVYEQAKIVAAALANDIEQLKADTQRFEIVALLHHENRRAVEPGLRDMILRGAPTDAQRAALAISTIEPKPNAEATRGEIEEWLKSDPALYRPVTDEGGWFEWRDNANILHRLVSPLRIEQEVAHCVDDLGDLVPLLRNSSSFEETCSTFYSANALKLRLTVLQGDIDRFNTEAVKRENEEWERWQKDWQALRSKR